MSFRENTIIIFDTNVFLDLYQYQPTTIEKILEWLEEIKDIIYLPNQVEKEFSKNQKKCRDENIKKYNKIESEINNKIDKVIKSINKQYKLYKKIDYKEDKKEADELVNELEKVKKMNSDKIRKINEEFLDKYKDIICKNDIIEVFVESIPNKIKEFKIKELIDIYEEGEKRYKYKIAPGYTDKDKFIGEKFGDLILWKEILREIKNKYVNLIFIENEKKNDWWRDFENLIPQEILKEEFDEVTSNSIEQKSTFEMLPFDKFIDKYDDKQIISTEIKKEIKRNNLLEYVKENFNDYIEEQRLFIKERIVDDIEEIVSDLGNITEVSDDTVIEIKKINLINVYFDEEEVYLDTKISISGNLDGIIGIDRGTISAVYIDLDITMDLSLKHNMDLNKEIIIKRNEWEVENYNIEYNNIIESYPVYECEGEYEFYKNT